ncbi:hypothetical protein EWO69_08540, partial [Campylobacter jejuni]|nr:hypothetical protein [Campylobacter jejuni]
KDSFDYLINNIKIKEEYKFIFYKILNMKNKVIIDGTKSCLDLAKFSYFDQNTYFYGFEVNPTSFALLKKEMKINNKIRIMHYYPYVKNTMFRVLHNANDSSKLNLHLMPDIDIPNSEKIRAINFIKFLFNIFNKHDFITLLILDINRDNYELILNIINNEIYQKIAYIVCKMDDIIIDSQGNYQKLYNLIKSKNINNIFLDFNTQEG